MKIVRCPVRTAGGSKIERIAANVWPTANSVVQFTDGSGLVRATVILRPNELRETIALLQAIERDVIAIAAVKAERETVAADARKARELLASLRPIRLVATPNGFKPQ